VKVTLEINGVEYIFCGYTGDSPIYIFGPKEKLADLIKQLEPEPERLQHDRGGSEERT
jgi:hypothetical protein